MQTCSFKLRFRNLFNTIWEEAGPPKSQQKAIVVSTFKKRNLKDCENCRGICLLNGGYKTFTRIINSKLEAIYRDIIGQQQNDFSQGQILG
jgi:hypothetical protein